MTSRKRSTKQPTSPGEGPGLLRAVLERPDDEPARLVYADWLEEQGDPHADYLRAQVALAQAVRSGQDHQEQANRERRLRVSLDPDWVARARRLTTEPYPFDVSELDPALASRARVSTRLHPRAGEVPELDASKLGGLFLWPEDEPWPVKDDFRMTGEGRAFARLAEPVPDGTTVPLAPILQLRVGDAPGLPFPPGTDLMQLFWVPLLATEYGPEPFVFWRRTADVVRPRRDEPSIPYSEWGLIPNPCRVYPEQIVEYPDHIDLAYRAPAELRKRIKGWYRGRPDESYDYGWSVCSGAKVGGYPWVNQSDCEEVHRESDGRPMELLLSLSLWEITHGHYRWCPIEDRDLCARDKPRPEELTGGLHAFSGGNYHVLIDRQVTPWAVKSYTVWSG
jgi:uncharacterized protein (TIGR02996 family)